MPFLKVSLHDVGHDQEAGDGHRGTEGQEADRSQGELLHSFRRLKELGNRDNVALFRWVAKGLGSQARDRWLGWWLGLRSRP